MTNKLLKGQSVTDQLELINENIANINEEIEKITSNEKGYITEQDIPVKSVQGKKGDVSLSAKDVGAFPNSSTIQELDINNIKDTGVYIGTYASNPYYLLVIKYNDTNIYQELIGLKFKQFRRFAGTWSEWIKEYSTENPVKAGDITGIELVDTDKELTLALLEDTTFVKADIKYNPSNKKLYVGDKEFATTEYVDNAVNMIKSIIVTELPAIGVPNTIYFVPSGGGNQNVFNEYIYVNSEWEIVGGTSIDLTPFLEKTVAEQTYAKISDLDEKVSKTTTINGKTLYNNITLTAEDVGALSKDTILVEDVVYRHTNAEISGKLTAGAFVENDLVISIDDGTYLKGHMYKYNSGVLTDITDMITDYVDLNSDQNINGTKNFNGVLKYGGVNVATTEDIEDLESKIPSVDSSLSTTSTNAVQNKIITEELNKKATQEALEEVEGKVDLKVNQSYVDDNFLPLTAGSDKKVTGPLHVDNNITIGNGKAYRAYDNSGAIRELLRLSTGNTVILGDANSSLDIATHGTVRPSAGKSLNLGTSTYSWDNMYGTKIYQDGKQVANKEDIPDVSGFIKKDVNDLTNYKNEAQLSQLLGAKQDEITSSNKLSKDLVSGLGTASTANTGTSSGNVPVLGTDGKLPSSVIPASAITNTYVVASESAMLALSNADVGDVCIRNDLRKSFILKETPYSTLSNWKELLAPTDTIQSVNGQTGHVILTAEDVGALPSNTEIPKINNGTLYFEKNGGIIGSFTTNQDFDSYFDVSMPPDTLYYGEMDLDEDQKRQARTNIGAGTSDFSGYFQDLQRVPSIVNTINGSTGHLTGIATEEFVYDAIANAGGGGVSEQVVDEKIAAATSDFVKKVNLGTQVIMEVNGSALTITSIQEE